MPLFAIVRYPIDLRSSEADIDELLRLVRDAEAETYERCAWIVVDTLSRAIAGGDENSPVDMGRIVLSADRIRAETSAHFTFVHHTGKDAARGARGHSLLRAATDTEIEVTPSAVSVTKQRDMESGLTIGFRLLDLPIRTGPDGEPIKSAVVEWIGDRDKRDAAENSVTVPRGQRLLMAVMREALDEAGQQIRPFHDGPFVRAVPDDIVRKRLYVRIAEQVDPGEDKAKLADRQRQAFNRSIETAIKSQTLNAAAVNGARYLWPP